VKLSYTTACASTCTRATTCSTRLHHRNAAGAALPTTQRIGELTDTAPLGGALLLAPPWAQISRWLAGTQDVISAFASGWKQVRGLQQQGLQAGSFQTEFGAESVD
jgi:hypothetical protein